MLVHSGRWLETQTSLRSVRMERHKSIAPATPNLARHERGCRICTHPSRVEIEQDFIAWRSPSKIASEYKLRNRATIYRHAHAVGLFPKRARNVRAALERIIEKIDDVPVSAAAVIQAIATYARINAQGQLVERSEQVNLNDLFDRMTLEELETYAKDGTLPWWFDRAVGATRVNSSDRGSDG
jgi:hypothetical protein